MHIIFESVLMLIAKKIITTSPYLSKLQLAKVGAFFSDTVCVSSVTCIYSQKPVLFISTHTVERKTT